MKTAAGAPLFFLLLLVSAPGIGAGSGKEAEPAALTPGEVVEVSGHIVIVGNYPFIRMALNTSSGRQYLLNAPDAKLEEVQQQSWRTGGVRIRARVLREGLGPMPPELELLSFTPPN